MAAVRVVHTLCYAFENAVERADLLLRLEPRADERQALAHHQLQITPLADELVREEDAFENRVLRAAVSCGTSLTLSAVSRVSLAAPGPPPPDTSWDAAGGPDVGASARVPVGARYAELVGPRVRPLGALLEDLAERLGAALSYDETAASPDRTVDDALGTGRGVCQDYAHAALAALRSIGVPARYVSGYLLPERPKHGAHGRLHAWIAVRSGAGWLGFDPLLRAWVSARHVALAVGRDHDDVAPISGRVLARGAFRLRSTVTVYPVPELTHRAG